MESWNLLLILKIATYGQTYEWCTEVFTAILFHLLAFFVTIQWNPFDK